MLGQDITTYIYIRPEDGKCVHSNCWMALTGREYEHDDPEWQPPTDWPYKIRDFRLDKKIDRKETHWDELELERRLGK